MKKILIVYWSGTGNTAAMADLIKQGIEKEGKEVDCIELSQFDTSQFDNYNVVVMGCPSMGDEVLEENEMEPFIEEIESKVQGKMIALFGSYGWGNGEWMDDWFRRMSDAGADMIGDKGLIVQDAPDSGSALECEIFGQKIATIL